MGFWNSFGTAVIHRMSRELQTALVGTARNFLSYLGADHPEVQRLDQQRSTRSSTPRLLASGLSRARPFHPHRPAPVSTYLCDRNASSRCGFSRRDEITRPHFSRDDHALSRCGADGPPARIRGSSFQTSSSCSAAEDTLHSPSRPRWSDRFFARRSTCARDVSPDVTKRHFSPSPRPPLQPAHQNPQ